MRTRSIHGDRWINDSSVICNGDPASSNRRFASPDGQAKEVLCKPSLRPSANPSGSPLSMGDLLHAFRRRDNLAHLVALLSFWPTRVAVAVADLVAAAAFQTNGAGARRLKWLAAAGHARLVGVLNNRRGIFDFSAGSHRQSGRSPSACCMLAR